MWLMNQETQEQKDLKKKIKYFIEMLLLLLLFSNSNKKPNKEKRDLWRIEWRICNYLLL